MWMLVICSKASIGEATKLASKMIAKMISKIYTIRAALNGRLKWRKCGREINTGKNLFCSLCSCRSSVLWTVWREHLPPRTRGCRRQYELHWLEVFPILVCSRTRNNQVNTLPFSAGTKPWIPCHPCPWPWCQYNSFALLGYRWWKETSIHVKMCDLFWTRMAASTRYMPGILWKNACMLTSYIDNENMQLFAQQFNWILSCCSVKYYGTFPLFISPTISVL